MAIEIDARCDDCNASIDSGEKILCEACYNRMVNEHDRMEDEIGALESKIEELQKEIREG